MQVVWSNRKISEGPNHGGLMENTELVNYFSEQLFVPEVKSQDKNKLFDEFADLFVDAKLIRKKENVVEMLRSRETLGSTGIGKGVAIPHGRTTAALEVKIAFGKCSEGMDFDAIDKKPVNLIFVVMAPPQDANNRYLPILGKLVEFVSESKNRKKLMTVETYEDLINVFGGDESA